MTGAEVRALRASLGLRQRELAAILGVAEPTARRWESARVLRAEARHVDLLQVMREMVADRSEHGARLLGDSLRRDLAEQGWLLALRRVLGLARLA